MKKFYLAVSSVGLGLLFPDDMKFSIVIFLLGMLVASLYFERGEFFGKAKEVEADEQSEVEADEQSDDETNDIAAK